MEIYKYQDSKRHDTKSIYLNTEEVEQIQDEPKPYMATACLFHPTEQDKCTYLNHYFVNISISNTSSKHLFLCMRRIKEGHATLGMKESQQYFNNIIRFHTPADCPAIPEMPPQLNFGCG